MIQTARPYFKNREQIIEGIRHILDSGELMHGKMVDTFENEFAEYVGTKYASSVNSCTTALEITLRYIGVKGYEVIVPTNTFVATANAVLFAGGKVVLADIKEGSYNIGVDEVERRITEKTKAVIVVHIAGIVCEDILEIKKLCDKKGVVLIEDCAHAHGAEFKGKKAGCFGYAGAFSFYPTKIMTTGTGGMIVSNDFELIEFANSIKYHGRGERSDVMINVGNDWFMDEIRATIGLWQLRDLDNMVARRRGIADRYRKKIADTTLWVSTFELHKDSYPSYYKFPVQIYDTVDCMMLKKDFAVKYNVNLESLYWPTVHLQIVYRKMFGYEEGSFPIARKILSKQVTLPMHSLIVQEDIDYVVGKLGEELSVA